MVPVGRDLQHKRQRAAASALIPMSTTTAPLVAALADHPFMSSMPIAALRRLGTHVQRHEYPAGHEMFREGAVADRFFLLRHGLVRLDIEVPGRGRVEVETVGQDAALGWSWLFSPFRWQLSATVIERTTTLAFDASALRSIMAADPVIGYELMRRFAAVMFDRLQATRAQLTESPGYVPSAGVGGPWAGKPTPVVSMDLTS
jgi:CRP/FNR family cyclic AMP-dependent transcriptional regulator